MKVIPQILSRFVELSASCVTGRRREMYSSEALSNGRSTFHSFSNKMNSVFQKVAMISSRSAKPDNKLRRSDSGSQPDVRSKSGPSPDRRQNAFVSLRQEEAICEVLNGYEEPNCLLRRF